MNITDPFGCLLQSQLSLRSSNQYQRAGTLTRHPFDAIAAEARLCCRLGQTTASGLGISHLGR